MSDNSIVLTEICHSYLWLLLIKWAKHMLHWSKQQSPYQIPVYGGIFVPQGLHRFFFWHTEICHEIPRFPKKSLWASLHRDGRNFIAKSWTISTHDEFKDLRTSSRQTSRWTRRSWCAFHSEIACLPFWAKKRISSLSSSHRYCLFSTCFTISCST